jgi:WD40 repeat protein
MIILGQTGELSVIKNKVWATFVIFIFLINACGGKQPGGEIQQTAVAATIYAKQVTPSPTIPPSATPVSIPTATPTPAPVAAGNPVPKPVEPITASNAARVIGLARWGKGETLREVAVAPDGKLFAVKTDRGIDVYDGDNLQLINHYEGTESIAQIIPEFREKGDQESMSSPDGQFFVEQSGPELVEKFIVPDPNFPNDGYWADVNVYYFNLVEASSGERRQTLESEYGGIASLAFSPDGKSIAIIIAADPVQEGRVLYFWNLDIDRARHYDLGTNAIDLAFSRDGKYLAIAKDDSTVEIRGITEVNVSSKQGGYEERRPEKFASIDQAGINEVHFLGTGENLITISENIAKVWSLKGGSLQQVFAFGEGLIANFGNDPLVNIAISPNAKYLAAASDLGLVTIWRTEDGRPLASWQTRHPEEYPYDNSIELGFTHDGDNLIILETSGSAHVYQWSLKTLGITRDREFEADRFYVPYTETNFAKLVDMEDELYLLDGGEEMILRQTSNFKEIKRFHCMATSPSNLLISPGKSLVFTYWREGEEPCRPYDEATPTPTSQVANEGKLHLLTWNFSGERLDEKKLDVNDILGWAMSPDGALLALVGTGQDSNILEIFETGSGKLVQQIDLYGGYKNTVSGLTPIAFSPDSSLLAIGNSEDQGIISLVQVSDGQILNTFLEHTDEITGLEFSQDGLWLASCSSDGTIRIWGIP